MPKMKRKVIAIVGPTACGKTGIGVRLAKEFDGEIVSADSRQVYRGLDIGTGKDLKEYDSVKYHMIDIVEPGEKMTLFDYLPLARKVIEDIFSRGKLPIIVGGTGLYVQGLVEGFELEQRKENNFVISNDNEKSHVRKDLSPLSPTAKGGFSSSLSDEVAHLRVDDEIGRDDKKKYSRGLLENKTIEQLNNILRGIDPEKFTIVDKKNRHRLIRAIELAQEGLKPTKVKPDFEVLQIGIDIPRSELHERIDKRVDERFKIGMLEEVIHLIESGVDTDWLKNLGLEYRVIAEYLLSRHPELDSGSSELSNRFRIPFDCAQGLSIIEDKSGMTDCANFDSMSQDLKWKIHQFARRQMTWFQRFPEINWLSDYKEIKRFVKIFLEH